jgi:hypothetical protein
LEPVEGSTSTFLDPFFRAYLEYLRRAGQHELANYLASRIGRLVAGIRRDETRSGVVQALLHGEGQGHSRFVHVSIERQADTREKPSWEAGITYARGRTDCIDARMQEAAASARLAVDALLKRTGYPDGLAERVVRWEIATLRGETIEATRPYKGGSIALPLAVSIISEYLARPVPNDVALTGAIDAVDAAPVKLEHAIHAGARLVYLPMGNMPDLEGRPALRDLAAEHRVRIAPVDTLDQVCGELFPPEGSGRLRDILKDMLVSFAGLLCRPTASGPDSASTHGSPGTDHHWHAMLCSLLTAGIFLAEGFMIHRTFAPTMSLVQAWSRILAASLTIVLGMGVTFALPGACLRHRRAWSWLASVPVLALCCGVAFVFYWPMLPPESEINRSVYTIPAATILKDMFVIWIFTWAIAANVYNAVAALEHLIQRRQFVTARACLNWDSPLEGRMPIHCVHFPWYVGAGVIFPVALFLIFWEWTYYSTLRPGTASGHCGRALDVLSGGGPPTDLPCRHRRSPAVL